MQNIDRNWNSSSTRGTWAELMATPEIAKVATTMTTDDEGVSGVNVGVKADGKDTIEQTAAVEEGEAVVIGEAAVVAGGCVNTIPNFFQLFSP